MIISMVELVEQGYTTKEVKTQTGRLADCRQRKKEKTADSSSSAAASKQMAALTEEWSFPVEASTG
jgi:hypothetical protein